MLAQINKKLWDWLTVWNVFLAKMERDAALQRNQHRLLIFFHGYSLSGQCFISETAFEKTQQDQPT